MLAIINPNPIAHGKGLLHWGGFPYSGVGSLGSISLLPMNSFANEQPRQLSHNRELGGMSLWPVR